MKVRDFRSGVTVFFWTFVCGVAIAYVIFNLLFPESEQKNVTSAMMMVTYVMLFLIVVLPFVGFFVNYTPLRIKDGVVVIPASDQLRTFWDLIMINPITGLYRRRKYSAKDIQNVANGYTKPETQDKKRSWSVVITGVQDGKSFSQKIKVSNKQVRDEVRNVLKQTISGRVNSEFTY